MRLFAGIFPGEDALRRITDVQRELRVRVRARASWVKPERLHITMRFFGDDADEEEALSVLKRAVEGRTAFSIELTKVGGFPRKSRARVGFIESLDSPELMAIATALAETNEREPHPHLTLVRFRRPAELPSAQFDPIRMDVSKLVLVRSVLVGPETGYTILHECELKG